VDLNRCFDPKATIQKDPTIQIKSGGNPKGAKNLRL
jgi:hypothetical protein